MSRRELGYLLLRNCHGPVSLQNKRQLVAAANWRVHSQYRPFAQGASTQRRPAALRPAGRPSALVGLQFLQCREGVSTLVRDRLGGRLGLPLGRHRGIGLARIGIEGKASCSAASSPRSIQPSGAAPAPRPPRHPAPDPSPAGWHALAGNRPRSCSSIRAGTGSRVTTQACASSAATCALHPHQILARPRFRVKLAVEADPG